MIILFLGGYDLAFFHLLTHALFKALLFICAGRYIHGLANFQDIRSIGSLISSMPLTSRMIIISNLSLCGLPFLRGFYSKDLLLEFYSMDGINIFIYFLFYFSTGLTAIYRFRLINYIIFGSFNFVVINYLNERFKIVIRIMVLFRFVLVGGSILI